MPQPVKISASRGSAILGQNQWKTPVQVWLEIMEQEKPGFAKLRGYLLPEPPDNAAIRWGLAFESAIIKLAEMKRSHNILSREMFFSCAPLQDFITCHIDGQYTDLPLYEGKSTSIFVYNEKWGEPGTDRIPREIMIQVQHQMICTRFENCIVSVLVFPKNVEEWEEKYPYDKGKEAFVYFDRDAWAKVLYEMGFFHQYEIKQNKELQNLMIEKYINFWENNILKEIEPEITDFEDIKLLCPEPVGTIIASEQVETWAAEYKDINAEIGSGGNLAKRKSQIKTQIMDYCIQYDAKFETVLDDDSVEKYIILDNKGKKLFQWDGKVFR